MPRLKVKAGTRIFKRGDKGNYAFFIRSGTVEIDLHTPDAPDGGKRDLGKGDIFGEYSLILEDGLRTATATAKTEMELEQIDRNEFTEKFEKIEPFFQKWIKVLIQRGLRS